MIIKKKGNVYKKDVLSDFFINKKGGVVIWFFAIGIVIALLWWGCK